MMKMLTSSVKYNVDDLADRLGINRRSVYRYIDTFKEAGFIVIKEDDYYHLSTESKYFKEISQLVHFTEEEAYIVNRLIDNLDDTNLLKQNLRKKLASVYNFSGLADCVVKGKNAVNVHALIEGLEGRKQVILKDYASSHTGDIRDRLVEAFAFTTNYIQVWCFDLESHENKLFNVARIGSVEITGKSWKATSLHKEGYIDIFRVSSYERFHIKLEMGVMAHNLLIEEYPLAERDLTQIADGRWLLDTMVSSYHGVARFVMGLANDIKIIATSNLKTYIHNYAIENLE